MAVTQQLASYLTVARIEEVPTVVRHEACRSLLNFIGCALGGCGNEAIELALKALRPYSGNPVASILGRSERLDPLYASVMNGISSHVLDFDDTVAKNFIHPTSPVASALFAYASATPTRGADLVEAFVLGVEAESRVGNAVYPWHYDAGWHITGTAGVFGAAAAMGKLFHLSEQQMVWALGLAATQASGLREMFGSMGKAFHAGHAARNGYAAALLAQAGFTAGINGIEGPRGFAHVTAGNRDLKRVTEGLGEHFEIMDNTYKPFPCGIVIHPTIDACIQIHRSGEAPASDIGSVSLTVAPIVLDLCNKKQISQGLEGKFSVYHAAAAGLVRGRAGIAEFTDEAVNDPEIKRVRELVSAKGDPNVAEDAVIAEVTLSNGARVAKHVLHAIGNVERPMTDKELEEKFRDQAGPLLGSERLDEVIAMCWKLDTMDDCRKLIATLVPA